MIIGRAIRWNRCEERILLVQAERSCVTPVAEYGLLLRPLLVSPRRCYINNALSREYRNTVNRKERPSIAAFISFFCERAAALSRAGLFAAPFYQFVYNDAIKSD